MTGRARHQIQILALIVALGLVGACKEHDQLAKEAPVLARANLKVDRIAIAGVVSEVATLADSAGREGWSLQIGDHLGRHKYGGLPIVSSSEVRAIVGQPNYDVMLDRYKDEDGCDPTILYDLRTILEGKARFIVFGSIQEDLTELSESEDEKTQSKTMTTTRTVWVHLRFYDLTDQQLVWDHRTFGRLSESKTHDMSDFIKEGKNEGFLGGLVRTVVNSAIKPEPKHPPAPRLDGVLANAFDNVGEYLKPEKKKK